jgi:hypothetical protein
MKKHLVVSASLLAIGLAACGGSSEKAKSPTQQIKDVQTKIIQAAKSGHLEAACQYTTQPDKCLAAMTMVKTMKIDVAAAIPSDWQSRIANAKVTFNGPNAASVPAMITGKPEQYVKVNGHWLSAATMDNSD